MENLGERLHGFLERGLWRFKISDWVLLSMIAFYSIVFSHYTIMRHHSFRSDAWDLGLIVQSIASAVRGRLFTNNVELFFSPSGSYFGVHFAPVLFIVVPFFYLARSVETILVLQSVVLALGAMPVYLISIRMLKDRVATLFIAVSYLLNPLLQGVNWYDFHTQAFFPLFMLLAIYFLERGSTAPFLFFLLMSLSTIEQAAYFILAYVPYSLLNMRGRERGLKNYGGRFLSKKIFHLFSGPLIMLMSSAAWIILSSAIKSAVNPNPPPEIKAASKFHLLGVSDPAEIPVKLLFDPPSVLRALQYEPDKKIFYILLTFAPSCFLALFSPLALLPVFLWLFVAALSNWTPYYSPSFQYSSFVLPFTHIALIDALGKMFGGLDAGEIRALIRRVSALMLLMGVLLAIFLSPISFVHGVGSYDYLRDYGVSAPSMVEESVKRVILEIPGEPLILTTPRVFPHISVNPNAYTIPPINHPSPELFKTFIEGLKNSVKFDYVLIASFWNREEANLIYAEFVKPSGDYGLLIRGAGLELYKRGYIGPPENITIRFTFRELYAYDVKIAGDTSSEAGKIMVLSASTLSVREVWYGPYVALPPGKYTARFRIKVDRILSGKLIDLEVYSRHVGRIALRGVSYEEFTEASAWQIFSVTFSLKGRVRDVEFRGLNPGVNATICLDYVEVVPE